MNLVSCGSQMVLNHSSSLGLEDFLVISLVLQYMDMHTKSEGGGYAHRGGCAYLWWLSWTAGLVCGDLKEKYGYWSLQAISRLLSFN